MNREAGDGNVIFTPGRWNSSFLREIHCKARAGTTAITKNGYPGLD
jgi:hypothetical protein